MSAETNIQIAQKAYADFGRGDISALLNAVDEKVEWVTPDIGHAPGGTYRGRAEVARFFQQVGETWEFRAFEPREYIASGDQVAVLGSYAFLPRHRPLGLVRLGHGVEDAGRQGGPLPGICRHRSAARRADPGSGRIREPGQNQLT